MGPTGAGKTSLVSLIPRFSDATSGEVDIDGIPVRMYDLKTLRAAIGIATQDVFLFSAAVYDAMGKDVSYALMPYDGAVYDIQTRTNSSRRMRRGL